MSKFLDQNDPKPKLEPLVLWAVSLNMNHMNKTLGCRLRELKNKGKVHFGRSKSGRRLLREWSLTDRFPLKSLRRSSSGLSER